MSAKRLIFALLIGASLVVALVWRTEITPLERAEKILGSEPVAVTVEGASDQPIAIDAGKSAIQAKIAPEKLDHILKCFPDLEADAQKSFKNVVETLVHQLAVDDQKILHNDVYHVRLPDGQEKRLRLYRERDQDRLQFYGVDADGDPVVEEIPTDDQYSPDQNVINKYLSRGEVFYHEKSYDYKLHDKGELTVLEINDAVVDFNVKTPQVFLGCNQDACYCDNQ